MAVIHDIGTVQLDSELHYVIVLGGCLWYSCDRTNYSTSLFITLENIVHAVDCCISDADRSISSLPRHPD